MVSQFSKILLVLSMTVSIIEVESGKRVLLHSDIDIIQELLGLKADIQGIKTELAAKDQMIATMNATIGEKNSKLATLEQKMQAVESTVTGLGSTYVRWGRTTCGGNSSQLIYKGYTAGNQNSENGNGANMLCLPEHPTWAQIDTSYVGGHLYGTEYDPSIKPFNFHNWEDMPCSVCRTHLPTTIMMPASTRCPNAWTLQYTGYLLSSKYNFARPSEYICVDEHPEALFHGERDEYGLEMFAVKVKCGVLPCQEYPDGQQLACAVCSL